MGPYLVHANVCRPQAMSGEQLYKFHLGGLRLCLETVQLGNLEYEKATMMLRGWV